MKDYTEMCRRLRALAEGCSRLSQQGYDLLNNAADAIEKLAAELEYTKRQYDLAVEDLEKIGWGKWIPVTERLPEKPGKYLVLKTSELGGKSWYYWQIVSYTNNLNKVDKYDFPGKKNKRPGWFDYDSEYGHYETGDEITHWMPLPKPPKEET